MTRVTMNTIITNQDLSGSIATGLFNRDVAPIISHGLHDSNKGKVHIEIGFKTRVLYQ